MEEWEERYPENRYAVLWKNKDEENRYSARWTFGRLRHRLEVGPTLRPPNSAPIATAAPTDQRQLAGGRDLHPRQGQVGVFISGCRLQRCDD